MFFISGVVSLDYFLITILPEEEKGSQKGSGPSSGAFSLDIISL